MVIHKAAACLVRTRDGTPELLVFRHPLAGVQIPKGSVEPGESPEEAAARELAEESGLTGVRVLGKFGRHEIAVGAGPTEDGPPEIQVWHTFLLASGRELPETWSHAASGSEIERGLVFEYFWIPVAEARGACVSRFHASIEFVARAVSKGSGGAE